MSGSLPEGVGSQTLDRGLQVLELVASSPAPLSVAEVAERAGLHRSITYRMVRTLEHRGLLVRDAAGRYAAGARLAALGRTVESTLRAVSAPLLAELAERTGRTAFVVVEQAGLAVTVHVEEPRHALIRVSYRPGHQHPVTSGAPGLALLAGGPALPGERPEVALARRRGWAESRGEVIPGFASCAAPVRDEAGRCVGAVALVFAATDSAAESVSGALAAAVVDTARAVGAALGRGSVGTAT